MVVSSQASCSFRKILSNCSLSSALSYEELKLLRMVLLREGNVAVGGADGIVKDSPERGVAALLKDVIVLVRLMFPFNGTGGGTARRLALLLELCKIVAPLNRRLTGGLTCVGVTVRLLHAREMRGVLLGPGGLVLNPRMEQILRASTMVV